MAKTVKVAVTGAAGQVAYSMLARLASGEVFGPETKVILQLLEITPALPALEGVAMELEDCSFPLLENVVLTDNPERAFDGCNYALLVGSFPRKQGMERKELLGINGKIFVAQGKALAAKAASDVRILVVGNPCNTNCLVARSNGREIPAGKVDCHDKVGSQSCKDSPGQKGWGSLLRRDSGYHLGKSQ
jgi:malate dehydrogenase